MNFLRDLVRWFIKGERRKNTPSSQHENKVPVQKVSIEPAAIPEVTAPETNYQSPTFDFLKENSSAEFMVDLQSIRPLAEQFDRAREELLRELQRLAPPKKRITEIFRKAA